MIETPYLLFLGDAPDALAAKVAQGIRDWRPEHALGQLRLPGCTADMRVPDMTLEEGLAAGARTLVVGVANRGGTIAEAWKPVLRQALALGYDRSPRCPARAARRRARGWRPTRMAR